MGKSFRKNPIRGNSYKDSEKQDKKIANRKFRKKEKQAIRGGKLSRIPHNLNEVYSISTMAKDGKHYISEENQTYKSMGK